MKDIISIIITAHNQECDIVRCLSSLVDADLDGIEVIVSDDMSTDGTAEAVSRFPFARFLSSREWGHAGGARNRGVREARGKYIWLFDGDDEFHADKVHGLAKFAEACDAEVIAFLFDYLFKDGDRRTRTRLPENGIGAEFLPIVDVMPWCKLVKRDKYVPSEERVHFQDTDWWYRQADACDSLAFYQESMLTWHLDNEGQSNRALDYAAKNSKRNGTLGLVPYTLGQWLEDRIPERDGINCRDLADIYCLVGRLWRVYLNARKPEVREACKSTLMRFAGQSVCPWKRG